MRQRFKLRTHAQTRLPGSARERSELWHAAHVVAWSYEGPTSDAQSSVTIIPSGQHIAMVADRKYEDRFLGYRLQFCSQVAHVPANQAAVTSSCRVIPDGLQQLLATEHLLGMRHQVMQQLKLGWRECDQRVVHSNLSSGQVHADRATADLARLALGSYSSFREAARST